MYRGKFFQVSLAAAGLALLSGGCMRERSVFDHELALTARRISPPAADSVRGRLQPDSSLQTWAADYYDLANATDPAEKRRRADDRNNILRRLVLLDDEYFLAWSTHLYGGQATVTSTGEIINTALTGAAAVITPGNATQILSAVASGLSAARTSVDKNFFFQQNVPTLVSKMEQLRAEVKVQLQQYYKKPVSEYTLDDGLQDFVRYYKSGTLTAAAEALNLEVNKDRQSAQDQLETTKGDTRVAAPRVKADTTATVIEAQAKKEIGNSALPGDR